MYTHTHRYIYIYIHTRIITHTYIIYVCNVVRVCIFAVQVCDGVCYRSVKSPFTVLHCQIGLWRILKQQGLDCQCVGTCWNMLEPLFVWDCACWKSKDKNTVFDGSRWSKWQICRTILALGREKPVTSVGGIWRPGFGALSVHFTSRIGKRMWKEKWNK